MFCLSNFPLTSPILLPGYNFSLSFVVFGIEADLSSLLQNPIVIVPSWIDRFLSCLTSVMKSFSLQNNSEDIWFLITNHGGQNPVKQHSDS